MVTISVCMIVKNEEDVLERCLSCVKVFADEIIIVDTGSEDRTKEIALDFTKKVYDFEWVDDFSKARNYSFSKATMDYQMWLDADDVIEETEIEKIIKLKQTLSPEIDIVMMKYDTSFDQWGNAIFTSTRSRLLKRQSGFKWMDPIHEYIPMEGNIIQSDIRISHRKEKVNDPNRNIEVYKKLENENHDFNPRQLYYYARELKDHAKYKKSIEYFNKFLDTSEGWIEDNIAACYSLAQCYKALGEHEKRVDVLIKSFNYDSPRTEICCELGYYYEHLEDYNKALGWFLVAYNLEKPDTTGFVLQDYIGYIPCIELCLCYYRIGDIEKAKIFNKKAEGYKPDSEAVKYNNDFFNSRGC